MITILNGFIYDAAQKDFVENETLEIASNLNIEIDAAGQYIMTGLTDMCAECCPLYDKYYLLSGVTQVECPADAADLSAEVSLNAVDAARDGVKYLKHASGILQCLYDDYVPGDFERMFKHQTVDFDSAHLNSVLAQLKSYDVVLVPTLALYRKNALGRITVPDIEVIDVMRNDSEVTLDDVFESLEPGRTANYKRYAEWAYSLMKIIAKRYMDIGGTVYIGTGAPAGIWNYPGVSMIEELEIFNELGISKREVLYKAVVEPMAIVGKHENFVVLGKNPLSSFQHLSSLNAVILDGNFYSRDDVLNDCVDPVAFNREFGG